MAFDAKPSTWLGAGYSLGSNAISLTTATAAGDKCLTELTDAEANATSGDIRKVVFALMEKLFAAYNATASADRPGKMTIQKTSAVNTATGVTTNVYTVTVYTQTSAQEVQDES